MQQFRGGMSEAMRQAARMQRKIEQLKAEIKDREHTAGAAGDKVKVTATCEGKLSRVEIDPEFLAAEGLEMVCDTVTAAANAALALADKHVEEEMAKITGAVKSHSR